MAEQRFLVEKQKVIDVTRLYFGVTFDALEQGDETYDLKVINLLTHLKKGLINAIETIPSAQPERKKGKWEMKPDPYGFFEEIPVCSECGCTTKMREKTRYCPNCGSDMRGKTK